MWPLTPREIPSSSSPSHLPQFSLLGTKPGPLQPPNQRSSYSLGNDGLAHHICTNDLSLRHFDAIFVGDTLGHSFNSLEPDFCGLDACLGYNASELPPGLRLLSSQYALGQPLDSFVEFAPQTWQSSPTTFQDVIKNRRARLKYTFDEDEEETFKTAEWLPSSRRLIRTIIPHDEARLSGAIDSCEHSSAV